MDTRAKEIYDEIVEAFVADEAQAELWGFASAAEFESLMPAASMERALFRAVAQAAAELEAQWDGKQRELQEYIDARRPHTLQWYADTVKRFPWNARGGAPADTGARDPLAYAGENITFPIKYASVSVEQNDLGVPTVVIKIATVDADGKPADANTYRSAVDQWFQRVKDAGVPVTVVATNADQISGEVRVWADVIGDAEEGALRAAVDRALRAYLLRLPFNGRLDLTAVCEAARAADPSVVMATADLRVTANRDSTAATTPLTPAQPYAIPAAGFFALHQTDFAVTVIPAEGGVVTT